MDPGRIPEILSLETEADEPKTETRWPWKKRDVLVLGTGQVKVVHTLALLSEIHSSIGILSFKETYPCEHIGDRYPKDISPRNDTKKTNDIPSYSHRIYIPSVNTLGKTTLGHYG